MPIQVERKGQDKLFINGEWVDAASGRRFATQHPATGEVVAEVAEGDAQDVDRAVKAARAALSGPWAKMSPAERERVLHKLADLVEKNAEALAQLESLNNGKTIREAKSGDVPLSVALLRYYGGW